MSFLRARRSREANFRPAPELRHGTQNSRFPRGGLLLRENSFPQFAHTARFSARSLRFVSSAHNFISRACSLRLRASNFSTDCFRAILPTISQEALA